MILLGKSRVLLPRSEREMLPLGPVRSMQL